MLRRKLLLDTRDESGQEVEPDHCGISVGIGSWVSRLWLWWQALKVTSHSRR